MKFARIVFWLAGVWGVMVITPLFFLFHTLERLAPPEITHPAYYYGFVTVTLVWQFVFFVIATDPVRFRPMMLLSVLEKWPYTGIMIALYLQKRLDSGQLLFEGADFLLGLLFLIAYTKTAGLRQASSPTNLS